MNARLDVQVTAFTREAFTKVVAERSGLPNKAAPTQQTLYLADYLTNAEARARTMVVESPH